MSSLLHHVGLLICVDFISYAGKIVVTNVKYVFPHSLCMIVGFFNYTPVNSAVKFKVTLWDLPTPGNSAVKFKVTLWDFPTIPVNSTVKFKVT